MIDIANHYGLDKKSFERRVKWVRDNDAELETLLPNADTPERYIAAVMAYRNVQKGKPIGYLVGLDACSSGPQLMSALMKDPIGAENTGLIGSKRKDLYEELINTMHKIDPKTKEYKRKNVKAALMPFFLWFKSSS